MPVTSLALRPYTPADENAAIELWRRTWAQHYPHIDFNARVAWWRERWRNELVPAARIVVAAVDDAETLPQSPLIPAQAGIRSSGKKLVGFVTVDPTTMYLDQIVVAPEYWGSNVAPILLDEAKRLSPRGLDLLVNKDNARAIRFYAKHGFVDAGEDRNPVSGIKVNRMRWRAAP